MIINSKWLEEYIEIPYSPKELEDKLTYLGLEATIKKSPVSEIKNVVVADVLEVTKHPNADKLKICKVFEGEKEWDVVCGAPNVEKGQKVVFAKLGAILGKGFKIKPVKIRGVKSEGMICAEDELGLSDNHDGIIVLPNNVQTGTNFKDYYASQGTIIEIDLTPNRPDCTSHIGVARDITLLTEGKLSIPMIEFQETGNEISESIDVEIKNGKSCPRYSARVIKGAKIGPSPDWLVNYLKSVGLRSVNNIVDASNFVLMETGHPLHTFNYDKIADKKIVVRNAKENEIVTTIDGEERKLSEDILLICDGEKPVAIAGIMGLENSEIDNETSNILIESAYFDPSAIRKGSKYLGLQTDSSYRFERGADHEGLIYALNRVTDLIVKLAGGTVCKGIVDNYKNKIEMDEIEIRFKKIDDLIGISFDKKWVEKKFRQLGCKINKVKDKSIFLISPSWRPDLEREVDYIEEIVRIFGMEKVPSAKHLQIHPVPGANSEYNNIELIRSTLASFGLSEVYNNSLVNEKFTSSFSENKNPVKVKNPLSLDMAFLRTSLIPGLVQTCQKNIRVQNHDIKIFEMGNVQSVDKKSITGAEEKLKFGVLLTGNIEEKLWKYTTRAANIYSLKGILEELGERFGITSFSYTQDNIKPFKNLITVKCGNDDLGFFGELSAEYLKNEWNIENSVFVLESDISVFLKHSRFVQKYQPLPKYPSIQRDISIVISKDITMEQAEKIIRRKGTKLLTNVKFYDLYHGKSIESNKKSFTFNLVFQNRERTLKDKEVDKIMAIIIKTLEKEIQAELR